MDSLRRPFFYLAVVLMMIIVLIEVGSTALPRGSSPSLAAIRSQVADDEDMAEALDELDAEQLADLSSRRPPGMGITYMALLDGLMLFTVLLMGASLLIPERIHGRIQGIVSLIVSILVILGGILMIFAALLLLIIMVSLFLAAPFGTIAYLAIYGFFDRGGANAILGLLMALKLGFAVSLVVAHQRFLQNRGLVLMIITSLVANVVIGFLHGLVPRFLVSITDDIAAIIVAILACIWAILMLVASLVAVVKAIRLRA